MTKNIFHQRFTINQQKRNERNQHKSFVIWFTGLSGAGKSTLAEALEIALHEKGVNTFLLDGDNVRHGLNKDLGFSPEDRSENIRRISEVAKLLVEAGVIVIATFISPYQKDRENAKSIIGDEHYFEVYLETPLSVCEARDVKGLYAKARSGTIQGFTGIDAPYEVPTNPNFKVDTSIFTPNQIVENLMNALHSYLKD